MDCIVAPYEADAQLAYLMKAGIAQAIISEDSDLLVYGCQKVGGVEVEDSTVYKLQCISLELCQLFCYELAGGTCGALPPCSHSSDTELIQPYS